MVILKLNEVKRLKFQSKLLDDRIKELRSKIELQAVRYSKLPKTESNNNKILQIQMEKLLELEIKKDRIQTKIDIILEELEVLPENLYKVMYYRIVESLRWNEISKKLNYSRAQCHRFYDIGRNLKT